MRDWIQKNAPDADATSLKLGWYPSRYATGLGSILNLDDITSHIPSDKNDIVILEEPEHLNWYRNGPRWTSRFRHVCGIAHTNYEAYAIADNEDKEGAPEEYFNVKASEELQAPFNLGSLAVGVRCFSLNTVACIPRRSCPSLSRKHESRDSLVDVHTGQGGAVLHGDGHAGPL